MYDDLSADELYQMGLDYEKRESETFDLLNIPREPEEQDLLRRKAYDYSRMVRECFQRSAEMGHARAQYKMAMRCKTVRDKQAEAFSWAMKAAEQNHGEACDFVADAYETGLGVAQDPQLAAHWRRQAFSNHSSLHYDYVKQRVAEELRAEAAKLKKHRWILLAIEIFFVFSVPLISCIATFLDISYLPYRKRQILMGFDDNALLTDKEIKKEVAIHMIHVIITALMLLRSLLYCGALVFAMLWLKKKMIQKADAAFPRWDDPDHWDWEKYADC